MSEGGLPTLDAAIRIHGTIDEAVLSGFLGQLGEVRNSSGPVVVEVTTLGGDAEIGRRLALEIRLLRDQGRDVYFFGKTTVYSAGITLMAAFPCDRRFVSADVSLLIHERRLQKELKLSGALRAGIPVVKDLLAELEHGQVLEREGFEALVQGSSLTIDALMSHVMEANWYLRGPEALKLGLVAGIV